MNSSEVASSIQPDHAPAGLAERQQAAIASLSTRALAGASISELFQNAAEILAASLSVEYCLILAYDPNAGQLTVQAGKGWQEGLVGAYHIQISEPGGEALLTSGQLIVSDLAEEPRLASIPLFQRYGLRSGMSVKIFGLSHPYGVIGVYGPTPRRFTNSDMNFLQSIANLLAAAIYRNQAHESLKQLTTHLEEELADRARLLQLLQDVTIAANQAETITEAMQTSLDLICGYTGWPLGHVFYRDQSAGDELRSAQIWSLRDPGRFEGFRRQTQDLRLKMGEGLPGKVLASGKVTLRRQAIRSDADFPRRRISEQEGVVDGLGLPVMAGKEIVAVMEFYTDKPMGVNLPLIEALGNIGTQLGRAVERRQAEEKIRASQRQLAEAQRVARMGSWEWDIATNRVLWSDEMRRIYGMEKRAFDENLGELRERIHPEDRDLLIQTARQTIQKNLPSFECVHRITRPSGEIRILRASGQSIFSAEGQVVKILGISQDISEQVLSDEKLRASEERFRTIFEGSAVGKVIIDLQRNIVTTNQSMQNILGYSARELEGMELSQLILPLDYENSRSTYESFFNEGENILQLEQRLLHKQKHIVWGNCTLSWLRKENGIPWFAIVMVEDITARKQMEAELSEVKRQLVASRELERLRLAQELHDEPLQELYGLMYQLSDFTKYIESSEGQDELQSAQDMVTRLINSLRSICRELRPPALAPFGLSGAIRELAERFSEDHPDIHLEVDLMEDGQALPKPVRLTLFRILQQALSNILRHAHAKRVEVRFEFNARQVLLEIQDDGQGFVVPKRWVSLVRGGHLGLAGAAERVETVDGEFHVISAPGQGTLIQVVVPRTTAVDVVPLGPAAT